MPSALDYERKTKQHLLYARLLLELATQERDTQYTPALLAAGTTQLNLAYDALIDEIQVQLNVRPHPSRNLIEITRGLQTRDIHSAEIEHLFTLEQDEHSWLTAMRQGNPGGSPEHPDARIIGSSVQQSHKDAPYRWLDAMEKLTQHIRTMMTEC